MTSFFMRLGFVCAVLLMMSGTTLATASWPPANEPVLRLHPQLPDVLQGELLDRLDLFPGVDGLRRVSFAQASWGGLLARIEVDDPQAHDGLRVLVRNLTRDQWDVLQERAAAILAGEDPPEAPISPLDKPVSRAHPRDVDPDSPDDLRTDPLRSVRSWPETPAPPTALPRELFLDAGPVPWRGRWLTVIDAGARVNVTGFNTFFTPMGQIGIAFGHGLTSRLVPLVGFHAGFGDMRGDFEDAFGDGRANVFGFTLSALMRQDIGVRHAFYLEAGGGFYMRSLFWDGIYVDPRTGQYYRGRTVEQQDWGWQLRTGWMRGRDHATRPRLMDVGFSVQSSAADPWHFSRDGRSFHGTDRDVWLVFSVRFWDGL